MLPDGAQYLVRSQPALDDTVQGVYGAIIIDLDDGEVPIEGPVVGIAGFYSDVELMQDLSFAEGVYVGVVSGDWCMTIRGLPEFELLPPLRRADDYELPLRMEVSYRDFVVRRDCSDLAVACSPDDSVEVVPGDRIASPHSAWPGNTVEIIAP